MGKQDVVALLALAAMFFLGMCVGGLIFAPAHASCARPINCSRDHNVEVCDCA